MEPRISEEGETRSGTSAVWMRGLFMLLFLLAFGIAQTLLWATAIVQFLWLLFAGESNGLLVRFGKSLSLWLAEAAQFITCGTDAKPFPWKAWPPSD
jgi:hypothetical protein